VVSGQLPGQWCFGQLRNAYPTDQANDLAMLKQPTNGQLTKLLTTDY
jgi:hypothetical protein